MKQIEFTNNIKTIVENDETIVGLAVGGSWITKEIDDFSDLDLIIVTREKISDDKTKMFRFAKKAGNLLSAFTGDHVGEARLLICLYDNPLLHVDYKFVTLEEFKTRIETPFILSDKNEELKKALENSKSLFPYPDYQWIEDRFWIWIHYALSKIGRGEFFEAFDFFSYLRMTVLGPLLQIKNGKLPRGVRKVETEISKKDLESLLTTVPLYDKFSLLTSLRNIVNLYKNMRTELFTEKVKLQKETEKKVMQYFEIIEKE
jgi:hypothetical protein